MWFGLQLSIASVAFGQADDLLVGIWSADEGFQIVDLLFRSDGRYQLDTRSTDPVLDFSSSERGRYAISGPTLILTPYDYLGEPQNAHYEFQVIGRFPDTDPARVRDFPGLSAQDRFAGGRPGSGTGRS